MEQIRQKTEEIMLKQYHLENLTNVLADMIYDKYQTTKDGNLHTLITITKEKINELNSELETLAKSTY